MSIDNLVPLVQCRFILSNITLPHFTYINWLEVIFDKCDLFSNTITANTSKVGQIQFIHCEWNSPQVNLEILDLDITNLYVNGEFSTTNSGNMRIINMRITGNTVFSTILSNNTLKSVVSGIEIISGNSVTLESKKGATILYSNIRSTEVIVKNFTEGHINGLFCTNVTFENTVIIEAVFSDIIAINTITGNSMGTSLMEPVLYTNLRAGVKIDFTGSFNKIANNSTPSLVSGTNVFI